MFQTPLGRTFACVRRSWGPVDRRVKNSGTVGAHRAPSIEHLDVLIVGAGISGIGGAVHLQQQRPGTTFVLLDALDSFGGTWWTHRYPGIRSDSDLFTFGYGFKPWTGPPIASADEILKYLGEVIDENDLEPHIRYHHRVDTAEWSTDERLWKVTVRRTDTDEELRFTAGFLWMCQGYYRHNTGYTPAWPGFDEYEGEVIHPQEWPEEVDLADKQVVVIGSGATAATLIPNIADDCAHVTMLQRSPTFFITGPTPTAGRHPRATSTSPTSGPTRSSAARSSRCRTS